VTEEARESVEGVVICMMSRCWELIFARCVYKAKSVGKAQPILRSSESGDVEFTVPLLLHA
jgi:hypothetical protein